MTRFRSLGSQARFVLFTIILMWLGAACAPGTDGLIVASAEVHDTTPDLGTEPVVVELPHIPAIDLPDLSGVNDFDELLQGHLSSLALSSADGVEVVTAQCAHGVPVLSADRSSSVFDTADLDDDDTVTYRFNERTGASEVFRDDGRTKVRIKTASDGSGVFVEEGSYHALSIETQADGSGRYYREEADSVTSVDVDTVGAGVYYHEEKRDGLLETITIGSDDSGQLYTETEDRLLTIEARVDGTGDLYLKEGRVISTLRVRSDGSWELDVASFPDELNVKVLADGSGHYRRRGEAGALSLDFNADGVSHWRGTPGPPVIVPEPPRFVVADRLPPLGTLATIEPPCATVLRFDSSVLFEIGEFEVLPEAAAVLAEVAPALTEAGGAIEIHGHTDANGSDSYNQMVNARTVEWRSSSPANTGLTTCCA